MLKFLFCFILIITTKGLPMKDLEINSIISNSNKIKIIENGKVASYSKSEKNYNKIINEFNIMLDGFYEMPAFGVSIHNETLKELKQGTFIEFVFEKSQSHNDMPFESLLIKVEPNYFGFNIIRKYENEYNGRCFYIQLNKSMENFYNFLKSFNNHSK